MSVRVRHMRESECMCLCICMCVRVVKVPSSLSHESWRYTWKKYQKIRVRACRGRMCMWSAGARVWECVNICRCACLCVCVCMVRTGVRAFVACSWVCVHVTMVCACLHDYYYEKQRVTHVGSVCAFRNMERDWRHHLHHPRKRSLGYAENRTREVVGPGKHHPIRQCRVRVRRLVHVRKPQNDLWSIKRTYYF